MPFSPPLKTEIEALAARYGQPRQVAVLLDGKPFNPINATDRVGEVCMVIRRTNGQLLTAIKTFYPAGAFRLLTGGVAPGESIEAALRREVVEETSLLVEIRRFLAVIEYRLDGPTQARFATFAFLLDEVGGTLEVQDPDERVGAFREITTDQLLDLATTLEQVADGYDAEIQGQWRDWGRFRAVVHRVVYDALTDDHHHANKR
jgi:ADP-ribose pyrophosphatase YjhB (NUDIX family)